MREEFTPLIFYIIILSLHLKNFDTQNNARHPIPADIFGSRSAMLHTVSVQLPALVANDIKKKREKEKNKTRSTFYRHLSDRK